MALFRAPSCWLSFLFFLFLLIFPEWAALELLNESFPAHTYLIAPRQCGNGLPHSGLLSDLPDGPDEGFFY